MFKLLANSEDAFQACGTYAVYRRVASNRKKLEALTGNAALGDSHKIVAAK